MDWLIHGKHLNMHPYVLYYPDNKIRKFFRKVVKKYKKIAKTIGFNRLLGVSNVVDIGVYKNHIESVIQQSQNHKIFSYCYNTESRYSKKQ